MAVQVAFLVTAALLTMAAVYPYESQAKAELECDEDSMRIITFSSSDYHLRVCRESKWHSTVVSMFMISMSNSQH